MTEASPHSEDLPALSVLDAARTFARDRYLSALLAPADARDDLLVLAAYLGEIQRIPLAVREAIAGEIRLQWWRDALAAEGASGHPVADAIRALRDRRGLDPALLMAPIEGYGRELYEDGVADTRELAAYVEETEGAAIRLALAILGSSGRPAAPLSGEAEVARALALTRLALTLPQHLAHGRLPVPAAWVSRAGDPRGCEAEAASAAARALMDELGHAAEAALARFKAKAGRIEVRALPAVLPAALVVPALSAALRPGRDVLGSVAEIAPLSRVWKLWFAHWRGRI
mgnify:CR=1 FL=1